MTDTPKDWYRRDRSGQMYWVTREGIVLLAMTADGQVAMHARIEIAQIITAWWDGRLFARNRCPVLMKLFDLEGHSDEEVGYEPPVPAPIEIAGGAAGLHKLWIARAEENRGLDPAALKQLVDAHDVVMAVWPAENSADGHGFLTLKGVDYLLAQAKRGLKKIPATMTAIPCTNKAHAELLQQAFDQQETLP
jgi:hypothetical protein